MVRGEEEERLEGPKVVDDSRENMFSKHNRAELTETHTNSHTFKADKIPVLRRGREHKVPP